MNRPHPLRFKRVQRKEGWVYVVVVYDVDSAHPASTGIPVHENDIENAGPGYNQAVSWAYATPRPDPRTRATYRILTKDHFLEDSPWTKRLLAKGRTFSPAYFPAHRSRLQNYIWPRWGYYRPSAIRPPEIDRVVPQSR